MSELPATLASDRKSPMPRVLPDNELNALLVEAEDNGLTLSDLAATCTQFSIAPRDLLNELSITIAEGYLERSLDYEFCDGVMNGIINAVVEVAMTEDMPEPAFSLYQAFDLGEWIRSEDLPGTDPGEKYARPVVEDIMRALRG
ncbi:MULTISPECIES: hypothetical protein [unclassified Pseudomonas]|uniref:hypothetical protein n=1 Tax=unclassified Pseudomonas TaxID=196821 RepID=UPI000A1F4064|nr:MULTISPECIES: hypothetical protein [unclassified Pseudomonas]